MATRYEHLGTHPERGPAVLRIWQENLHDLRECASLEERFRWSYDKNPAGSADTVLACGGRHGEPIGCGSIYPRRLSVSGRELPIGIPADVAVDRPYRTAGAALGIQRTLIADRPGQPAFFIGFPNKSALPIFLHVGYRPLATAGAWVKPLDATYKLRERMPLPVARAAAAPINLYLRAADARRGRDAGRLATEFVTRADDRFDTLWQRARRNHVVTGERTVAYLNWRYTSCPMRKYRFFCVSNDEGLLGYVAFTTEDGKAFVGDVFALDMKATADTLLLAFAKTLRQQGYQSIFMLYAGNAAFAARIERLGFIRRPSSGRQLVALHRLGANREADVLMNAENWHLFDGEMDV